MPGGASVSGWAVAGDVGEGLELYHLPVAPGRFGFTFTAARSKQAHGSRNNLLFAQDGFVLRVGHEAL